ncbi:PEP-CTERM sorting domain-containing protein [Pedosphaera parvula]|uniref:Ice-binding protein C-terminal domain-containing protein n=1 Tax=Pedosphaera parvula (strain Ellin514) TaxID=320771 RepID=B9XEB8_PEDPL|nr:PEP-CTERM sorting domain-containing protein [Pedosphaera parvula]EEF61632.1 protein of unknown function DUF1555 [Pedosphaera parvula Ellin514]
MKKLLVLLSASGVAALSAQAQVSLTGSPYTQNFDTLANSGTANTWTDNTTIAGWYAGTSGTFSGTYRADIGSSTTGAIYSYGSSAATDRALGSVASGTTGTLAYGVRLQNNTGGMIGNLNLSYTGEQWRNGGNATAQTLSLTYRISSGPITSSDAAGTQSWTSYASLNFTSPTTGATAAALDGNNAANHTFISATLTGITLNAGDEIFFRWVDLNDAGNDHGLAVDDFTLSYDPVAVPEPSTFALLGVGAMAGMFVLVRRKK